MPNVTSFVSKGGGKETVVLTLEEYETLRLLVVVRQCNQFFMRHHPVPPVC